MSNKKNAATETNERQPVSQRGVELLALIAAAQDDGEGYLMLTQEEGLDAVNAGYAVVDTSNAVGNTAAVTLTDAGRAALTGSGGSASKYAIDDGFVIPEGAARRGRTSAYPFEMLDNGQSFHIPLKAGENAEKVLARIQSSISSARARFAVESGDTETVTVREYQRDENGKFVKDENGKRIVIGTSEVTRPVKTFTRDFKAIAVGEEDARGPGVRVGRVK